MHELTREPFVSRSVRSGKWRPYLFIALAGLLAFAPVSFMLQALKNDIIVLEYPINYFISESVRNGEVPYWFNTWGMGFPLQSNLTWGVFSTPQLFFSALFSYNIWVLHIEFMFFVLLSGWSMFYLLRKFLIKDESLAQMLAIAYMLSGFMVGSSQWLLYITAAAFVPLVIASLLSLLQRPSVFHAIHFAVMYLLMFTSVYAAFNIISTYALLIFIIVYILRNRKDAVSRLKYLLLAGSLATILCLPVLYFTSEVLQHISRGDAIETQTSFFNSNYLHPAALSSLLLPFSSVRMPYANTEGTMLNTYMGLFVVLFLPATIWQHIKQRDRSAWLILGAALVFLLASFGHMTPVRSALNLLPGFSYFRNPAIFRFYFILTIIVYMGFVWKDYTWTGLMLNKGSGMNRVASYTFVALLLICFITLFANLKALSNVPDSVTTFIKNLSHRQALGISAGIQACLLLLLSFLIIKRKVKTARLLFIADLIVNLFICTPFFTVSSYSLREVNNILHSEKGFPIQQEKPGDVAAIYTDDRGTTWDNANVYRKKVSSHPSYRGPLVLKNATDSLLSASFTDRPLVFATNERAVRSLAITIQRPTHIRVEVDLLEATTIKALQNQYPGWNVYYNSEQQELTNVTLPGLSVDVPAGKGTIDFRYERKGVCWSAMALHLFTIGFLVYMAWRAFSQRARREPKSSSPSLHHQ